MEVFDIEDMFQLFFNDGFSVEALSLATGVSVDFINRRYAKEKEACLDIDNTFIIMDFMSRIYIKDIFFTGQLLKDQVAFFCEEFAISEQTIAKYLNLSEEEMKVFFENPSSYPNGYFLSLKLTHLMTMFTMVRSYL